MKETMKKAEEEKNQFGSPTFADLGNGRLRCVETGHEVIAGDKESYVRSKRCRLGFIDHALAQGKSPLDMFSQCPLFRIEIGEKFEAFFWFCSKLVCKLTGDTVNKNEEHIWKHVNGKKISSQTRASRMRSCIKRKDRENKGNKPRRDMEDSDSEGSDFWMLKSSSGSESEEETDEGNCKGSHCHAKESEELSERTKRMSIQIGQSSFASRKKRLRMFLKIKN